MKIAIPLAEGRLSPHFGHCEHFALIEVDQDSKQVVSQAVSEAPTHEPGALPRWLFENGVQVVLAGGMGRRAQAMLAEGGIDVIVGVPAAAPEQLADDFLNGRLQTGQNLCDH